MVRLEPISEHNNEKWYPYKVRIAWVEIDWAVIVCLR